MTKSELVERLASAHRLSADDAKLAVDVILDAMAGALAQGHRVEIRDFGAFSTHPVRARIGRNPKTGQRVEVPSRLRIHFRPGKALAERTNASVELPSAAPADPWQCVRELVDEYR